MTVSPSVLYRMLATILLLAALVVTGVVAVPLATGLLLEALQFLWRTLPELVYH